MAKYRSGRINEEIKKEVSSIIQNDIKDPRLSAMVSITNVDVTKDLRYAKIFVSIFGSEESKQESIEALKSSAGFVRREVGNRINLRYTPQILFEIDNSIEHGMHINQILHDIKEKDANDNK